jgi:hypothetical protein
MATNMSTSNQSLTSKRSIKAQNFLVSRAISSSGMLSYCSSKDVAKEDRANSKVDDTVVVGLALWPPTRSLVTKALLVREAS